MRLLIPIPVLVWWLLGPIAAAIAFVVIAPTLWKQEHHFLFGRQRDEDPTPTD
jgi:hypothetical protein